MAVRCEIFSSMLKEYMFFVLLSWSHAGFLLTIQFACASLHCASRSVTGSLKPRCIHRLRKLFVAELLRSPPAIQWSVWTTLTAEMHSVTVVVSPHEFDSAKISFVLIGWFAIRHVTVTQSSAGHDVIYSHSFICLMLPDTTHERRRHHQWRLCVGAGWNGLLP